jgi:hypothetical protein
VQENTYNGNGSDDYMEENMRLKLTKNSSAKAWLVVKDGTVTPPNMKGWKTPFIAEKNTDGA